MTNTKEQMIRIIKEQPDDSSFDGTMVGVGGSVHTITQPAWKMRGEAGWL